ncbi:hypothetical protein ONZ45_g13219 [Pleurotus djamor]|nr:hypothetical protein ONZ45_g13219 [Pleurotus djamor]
MNDDSVTASGQPIVSRAKTAPFLIRAFIKIGSFHRLTLFEDGTLPTTDEQQIFTWKDATLREVVTTIRNTASHVPEYRHPLAKFSFRTVYADPGNKGRFSQKDLGLVYSRDILGEPGTLESIAPRLLEDEDHEIREPSAREKEERSLDELRFVPGDYLLVAVLLPKNVTMPTELSIKGAGGAGAQSNGWKGRGDSGWGGATASTAPGRGGGHWRGDSNAPPPPAGGRGRGGRSDFDRRVPPPRRGESPPPYRGDRGGRGGRGGRPRSRSRSPRRRRYD